MIMQRNIKSANVEFDDYGFLKYPETWTRETSQFLAVEEVPADLTREHWQIIDYLRKYFIENNTIPTVEMLMQHTGFTIEHIYELFFHGFYRGACKVAGIPGRVVMVHECAGS